jgi:hypothetical protein
MWLDADVVWECEFDRSAGEHDERGLQEPDDEGSGAGERVEHVDTLVGQGCAELGDHLACQGIQKVTLESTSDYWRIWFYLLEARGLDVQLVNARDVKNVPGRPKTDLLTELPDRILGSSPRPPLAVARLRAHGQRRGCAAGVVAVGGAAARVA